MLHSKINITKSFQKYYLYIQPQVILLLLKSMKSIIAQSIQIFNRRTMKANMQAQQSLPNHSDIYKRLIKQIAIYRYHFQKNPITIDKIIANIIFGLKIIHPSSKIYDVSVFQPFFEQKSDNFNEGILKDCLQLIIYLLKKQVQKIRQTLHQIQIQQLSNRVINILSHFFRINHEYFVFIGQQYWLLTQEDIQKIFNCSNQYLLYLFGVFQKNLNNIEHIRLLSHQGQLINTLVAIRLKIQINKRLRSQKYPSSEDIQKVLLNVRSFYSINIASQEIKQPLSNFSKPFLDGKSRTIKLRERIRDQIKQLIIKDINQLQFQEYIQKIREKYNVSMNVLTNLYNRIKDKKECQIQKMPAKKKQAFEIFNYYRYKSQYRSFTDICSKIKKQRSLSTRWLILQGCKEQMLALGALQFKNYQQILLKMIETHYQRHQILLIDHIQFYRKQFHLYNMLFKNISTQSKQYYFNTPLQDSIMHLITGITTDGILFYEIVTTKLTYCPYFDKLIQILDSINGKLPKAVVVYFALQFYQRELVKINTFIKLLRKRGTILYILPVSMKKINPNKKIQVYLKHKLLKQLSHEVNSQDFVDKMSNKLIKQFEKLFQLPQKPQIQSFWNMSRSYMQDNHEN